MVEKTVASQVVDLAASWAFEMADTKVGMKGLS